MKWGRRVALILTVCGIGVLVIAGFWPAQKEPSYQGETLSEWIEIYQRYGSDKQGEATKAVRAIGTNALPYLLRRSFFEIPNWKVTGARVCPPLRELFFHDHQKRFQTAMMGFHMLGPVGGPAIPQLVRLAQGTNRAFAETAVCVLGNIGDEAAPVVLDILTNKQAYPSVPRYALSGVAWWHSISNREPVASVLLECLKSNDIQTRRDSAILLGHLNASPGLTVPALIAVLEDQDEEVRFDAIMALRNFHKKAHPAAARLLNILDVEKKPIMRDTITETLEVIAPDVLTNRVMKRD